jgi:hypothetical protein
MRKGASMRTSHTGSVPKALLIITPAPAFSTLCNTVGDARIGKGTNYKAGKREATEHTPPTKKN